MNASVQLDPHAHLQSLYMSLLTRQERFDEFKHLLSLYPDIPEAADTEPEEAREVREALNERIAEWTGRPLARLSATEMRIWRGVLVDQRVNIAISPWKEANHY